MATKEEKEIAAAQKAEAKRIAAEAKAAEKEVVQATDPYNRAVGPNGLPLCMDGCGEEVGQVTTKFRIGHDSKLKSLALKVHKGQEPMSAIPDIGMAYATDYLVWLAENKPYTPPEPKAEKAAESNESTAPESSEEAKEPEAVGAGAVSN